MAHNITPSSRRPSDVLAATKPEAFPVLAAGTTLGDVRLLRPAASGLSSVIYEAENMVRRKRCAVKVFRPELNGTPVQRGRYEHLARHIARLEHPSIVPVYGFGTTPEGMLYSVGDWVEGVSLRRLLREHGALPRSSYLPLLRRICNGLAAAHGVHVAHRRLHAGNVIVQQTTEDTLQAMLVDFGVCQLHPPANEPPPNMVLHPEHAAYVAPEQAKGEAGDQRSDIYAVTVLLYQMITDQLPILADSYAETLDAQITVAPTPPSRYVALPADVEETIMRGLEKDPRRRIPSSEALIAALDPVSATTGQHHLRVQSHQQRRRGVATSEYSVSSLYPKVQVSTDTTVGGKGAAKDVALDQLLKPRRRRRRIIVIGLIAVLVGALIAVLAWPNAEAPVEPTAPTTTVPRPPRRGVRTSPPRTTRTPRR